MFGLINASLDTGGLFGTRIFEVGELSNGTVATPDIVIGNAANGTPLLVAHDISVTADLGRIDVTGTVDASGTGPGSIALQATGNVVLDAANGTRCWTRTPRPRRWTATASRSMPRTVRM